MKGDFQLTGVLAIALEALKAIRDVKCLPADELADVGDIGMSKDAKPYCHALGTCHVLAVDALHLVECVKGLPYGTFDAKEDEAP